jgi:hypothetical protein
VLLVSACILLGVQALPRSDTAHNPNNPNKHLLARAVTADPTKLDGKSFDFVIVGYVSSSHLSKYHTYAHLRGGTAGLAMAARLSG